MSRRTDRSRDLIFGLLALQNGLIDQVQLVAAFQSWVRDKSRALAEHLVASGHLDEDDRAAVEALVTRHLKKHGGDPEASVASIPVGRSTREHLAALCDGAPTADVAHFESGLPDTDGADADRTTSYAIGSATSEGERFRVLRPHAKGGRGAVFVALDSELHREVALKQILDAHADDPVSRQRFLLEAEITGGLEHPGIVPVYGLGTYGRGRPFYVMRFVRGDSLKEAIESFHNDLRLRRDRSARTLELHKLLRRFLDVCNAIEYAHGRGVLHRDIKPGNVVVGKHGETLVVDWGLAKATGRADPNAGERTLVPSSSSGSAETLPGSALGTPAYMSPEQASGDLEQLGPRSDVYSLGATLYCLLTGKAPFEGDALNVLRSVQKGEFPPPRRIDPALDRALEAVCLKAMALKPEDRFSTPKALADDIERWMADEPVSSWREPWPTRARRWVSRHRTQVAAGVAALVVAVAGLAVLLASQARANRDLQNALDRLTAAQGDIRVHSAQAEEAIESFYGGISEDVILRRPELEQLRRRLLDTALRFYERRVQSLMDSPGQLNDPFKMRTAVWGLDRIASLQGLTGDRDSAIRTRLRLVDLYAETPGFAPSEAAQAMLNLGELQRLSGRPNDALRSLRGALDHFERLPTEGASSAADVALAQADLGRLLHDIGKVDEARHMLENAREIQEALLKHPERFGAASLAETYTTLGNLHEAEQQHED